MLKRLAVLFFVVFLTGCYYQYSYKLIEPVHTSISTEKLTKEGIDLITFFDEKYIYVLGVVDTHDNIILFDKRKPSIIFAGGIIVASSLNGDELKISLKNVKYFYLKRRMPDTEEEAVQP